MKMNINLFSQYLMEKISLNINLKVIYYMHLLIMLINQIFMLLNLISDK